MTSDEQGYNGWTNYETWAVNLHLTNDEASYRTLQYVVSKPTDTVSERADTLKDLVTEWCLPEDGPQPSLLAQDLLGAALSSVNWHEIIRAHEDDNA